MDFVPITESISYFPAAESPLSADVGLIRGGDCLWIYDVGASDAAAAMIRALPGPKRIVLSHFHADHAGNLNRVTCDALYAGSFTCKRFKTGTAVDAEMAFPDGVCLFPLPSSHAKGCAGLRFGEYAFLGDAVYPMEKDGRAAHNAGQLQALIQTLERLPVRWFLVSHQTPLTAKKEDVLSRLRALYARRDRQSPYIFMEDEA